MLLNASPELPESAMMNLNQVYWQLNYHESAFQILQITVPKVVYFWWKQNANTVNQCCDDEIPLNKVTTRQVIKTPWPEMNTVSYLPKWFTMAIGELQPHIASQFKRFADFTGYVNHIQYFSHLNHGIYIWHNPLAVPWMDLQCDIHPVHTVSWTGSTRWRTHKQPRYNTVLLGMGTSPDGNFTSTGGRIRALLKCLFVIDDAESRIQRDSFLVSDNCNSIDTLNWWYGPCQGETSTCHTTIT
jgi:hypothetical protein